MTEKSNLMILDNTGIDSNYARMLLFVFCFLVNLKISPNSRDYPSLHQGVVVMSSQIKHTRSHQDTPLSPYTLFSELIFSSCAIFSLSQPHHVMASLPSSCDNHQSTGGGSVKTQCQVKMAA